MLLNLSNLESISITIKNSNSEIVHFYQSREKLLKELRAMNAGDAADQVIRQIDKIMRNNERASRDLQVNKVYMNLEEEIYFCYSVSLIANNIHTDTHYLIL